MTAPANPYSHAQRHLHARRRDVVSEGLALAGEIARMDGLIGEAANRMMELRAEGAAINAELRAMGRRS